MVARSKATALSLAAHSVSPGTSHSGNVVDTDQQSELHTPSGVAAPVDNSYFPRHEKQAPGNNLLGRGLCKTNTIEKTVYRAATVHEAPESSCSEVNSTCWIPFATKAPSIFGREDDNAASEYPDGASNENGTLSPDFNAKKPSRGKPKKCSVDVTVTVVKTVTATVQYTPRATSLTTEVPGETAWDDETLVPMATKTASSGANRGPRPCFFDSVDL